MPEGDAVYRTARRLRRALDGRVLTRSDFRVPRHASADLTGRGVHETVSRGKHLLTRVEGGLTVHTHLRMDGSWRVLPAGARLPAGDLRTDAIRLILANAEWLAAGVRLGVVDLLPTAEEDRVVGHLGPDLLGPDWDLAEAVRRLSGAPAETIGVALLDQRNLAGIGTIYRAETLFLAGVSPWRPVGAFKDAASLGKVVDLAHRLLTANRDRAGIVTTGDARPGRSTWVYGRPGRSCHRCGTRIRTGSLGGVGPSEHGWPRSGQRPSSSEESREESRPDESRSSEESRAGVRGGMRRTPHQDPVKDTRGGRPSQERLIYWCPSCQPA
ncbi:putative endonuclease 8 2 [Microtetraspora sp. NBRC 13810]|uniref:DNA-formamidopyrimidine glycosylase family protein n=1 Tax=Microtetraspora sp. NBRC 13810 TaxID=3030990 RepID=UPI0024A0CC5D|nr:DNA-formamidopyrimidine glycosylase family protein [Microtetraspora sp. NBRC 13810]GLW08524.1 putative endonuclease 8 2 [Microtetraspora sp. NBRC 13810]